MDIKVMRCLTRRVVYLLPVLMASNQFAFADTRLTYQTTLTTEYIAQNIEPDDQDSISADNVIIKPSLSIDYISKTFTGFWRANHNHVRRSLVDEDITRNYTDFTYGGAFRAIDDLLVISSTGRLNNRAFGIDSFLVDDFLLNAENINKSRSNSVAADLTLPRGEYFGFTGGVRLVKTESESQDEDNPGFDNQGYDFNTQIVSGDGFDRLFGQLNTNMRSNQRGRNQGDYFTRNISGNLSVRLFNQIGVLFSFTNEGNQVDSEDDVFSNSRNFNTYGLGLTFRKSVNRYISLTANKIDGNELTQAEEDADKENDIFAGLDMLWQFTPRTSVGATYGRRFFGETGTFNFSHRIKRFRTQISYNEDVTSLSNLFTQPENLGVFVCADGITDLSSCFQPNSLQYDLAPNEEFVQFTVPNIELNDELILRQSFNWQLGVAQRRTSFSFNGRYSVNDYLESPRFTRTNSAGVSFSLGLGAKTNLSLNADYASTKNTRDGEYGESKVLNASISIDTKIGQRLSTKLTYRYLDRETEGDIIGGNNSFRGIEGDLTDSRVTFDVSYVYGNRTK